MATDLLKLSTHGISPVIVLVPKQEFEQRLLKTKVFNNRFMVIQTQPILNKN